MLDGVVACVCVLDSIVVVIGSCILVAYVTTRGDKKDVLLEGILKGDIRGILRGCVITCICR